MFSFERPDTFGFSNKLGMYEKNIFTNNIILWGCSSVGRAPALQAGGQEFESPHLHHIVFRLIV